MREVRLVSPCIKVAWGRGGIINQYESTLSLSLSQTVSDVN